MFSQTSEYTLRVVVFLASIGGKVATTRQIAAATHVPEGYLAKILRILGRAGMVTSQRGLHGGSTLAQDPANLTVYDVMQVVSPLQRITSCPLHLKEHGTELCKVHRRLDDAIALVENALKSSTIAELATENSMKVPLSRLGTDPVATTQAAEAVFPIHVRVNKKQPANSSTE